MKKFLFLASGAALALASCSDDLGLKTESPKVEGKSTIVASYPMNDGEETRTTLGNNGSSFYYEWSKNDQIGVFNYALESNAGSLEAVDDITNAVFTFSESQGTSQGKFVGDTDILDGGSYVAYYPWYGGATLNNGDLTVSILPTQNFNFQAYNNNEGWNDNIPNGCFSTNVAPAIAWGTAVGADNLSLQFYGVASYLVLPLAGYSKDNVTEISLQVTQPGGAGYQALTGAISIDMQEFMANPAQANPGLVNTTADDTNNKITLNVGSKGLALDPVQPVNLWFVVPADLNLEGSTIELTVEGVTLTRTFTTNNVNKQVMGRNQVRWIWAANDTPFIYNEGDSYLITNQYQFLEYAYLVSNPASEVYDAWNALQNKYYSDLENMCTISGGAITFVKPALIVGDINFNASEVGNYIKGSLPFGSNVLEGYYQSVFGDYAENDYITPIGGLYSTTFSGMNNATLNGLNVMGTSVFGWANGTVNLSDLTFTNVTVDSSKIGDKTSKNPTYYYFLSNTYSANVVCDNVTIGSGCEVKVNPQVQKPVVAVLNNAWATSFDGEAIENESDIAAYANTFHANSNFSFPGEGVAVTDFNAYDITTEGVVLTVSSSTMAGDLISAVGTPAQAYSVVDNASAPTSYWTGTAYPSQTLGYAENLASAVAQTSATPITLNKNIDLMNTAWVATNPQTVNVTLSKNVTISNVKINGSNGKTGAAAVTTNYLTLLGAGSSVVSSGTNNFSLTLSNINITNTPSTANQNYVAALSAWPYSTNNAVKNVIVNGMTVNATSASYSGVGGLFAAISADPLQVKLIQNCQVSNFTFSGGTSNVKAGYLAGNLNFTASNDTYTLTNPVTNSSAYPAIATYTFQIAPTTGDDKSTTVNLVDFDTAFASNFVPTMASGYTGSSNSGYTVFVVNGSQKYIYKYINTSTTGTANWKFVLQ